jgi:thiol:disulfide interchange protein DsbD
MMRAGRFRLALFAAWALISGAAAWGQEQPLRWHVEVVPAQAKPGDEVEVVFTADIGAGWILYSSDFSVEIGPRPAKFIFEPNPSLSLLGPVQALHSQRKKDHTFGTEYAYFEKRAEFRQKARLLAPLTPVSGRIEGQTCYEESGLCELFRENFKAGL